MKKLCCIISAGDVNLPLLKANKFKYDFFIAADRGYEKALEADITPSLLVGDFDSISQFPATTDGNVNVIRHPVEKDYSDTHLALEEGIKLGYTDFHIYGALGGDRFSHSLSNIQTLCTMKSKNISATIIGMQEQLYLLENENITLSPPIGSSFSVFSLSDTAMGVSIEGAKYHLDDATLTNTHPVGLSNESVENLITISVRRGYLLVVLEI